MPDVFRRFRAASGRAAATATVAAVLLVQPADSAASEDTERLGDVLRVALPAAAYAVTFKRDDRDGRRQFYRSFGATVLGTLVLKETVDKRRPDGTGDDAFPSGHAATAFQGAAFLHRRYGIRAAWPAYLLAGFTAWSRVAADEHDRSDVVAGAAAGFGSAWLLAERGPVAWSATVADGGFAIHFARRPSPSFDRRRSASRAAARGRHGW